MRCSHLKKRKVELVEYSNTVIVLDVGSHIYILLSNCMSPFIAAALFASILLQRRAREAENSLDYVEKDELNEQAK